MVLSDPEMIGQIKQHIQDNKVNAESSLKEVTDMYIGMFEAMDDNAYMQERAADIRDVTKRVMAHLLGVSLPDPSMIDEEVIVVAHDLTPSDTAQLDKNFVKAFVTDIGDVRLTQQSWLVHWKSQQSLVRRKSLLKLKKAMFLQLTELLVKQL